MDCLVLPVQGRMEEWKRSTAAIDKEHAKGTCTETKGNIAFPHFVKTENNVITREIIK